MDRFHTLWYTENKPHGFEVQEARLGGLLYRLGACKKRLLSYLDGKENTLPELEEELLPIPEKLIRHTWASIISTSRM